MHTPLPDIKVIPMQEGHLPAVLRLEQESFDNPWSEEAWRAELACQDARCLVALDAGRHVVGVLAVRLGGDEGQIMKLAVRLEMRRRGIAALLMDAGMELLQQAGCRRLFLELRVSNHEAAAFYRSRGFSPVGVRKGYYSHPTEEAVVMGRDL